MPDEPTIEPKPKRYTLSFSDICKDDDASHQKESVESFARGSAKQRKDRTPK